jgi:hypothetical protein
MTADLDVGIRLAAEQVGGRVQAQRLLEDAQHPGEPRQVLVPRRSAERVHFGLHLLVHVGMAHQQVHGPGERIRCRLVASDEECEHLVAYLSVVHARAVLVACHQQPRQQILSREPCGTPLLDHARHPFVQHADRLLQPARRRTQEQDRTMQPAGESPGGLRQRGRQPCRAPLQRFSG